MKRRAELEKDYLAPFLVQLNDPQQLSNADSAWVREACLKDLKVLRGCAALCLGYSKRFSFSVIYGSTIRGEPRCIILRIVISMSDCQ